MEVDGVRIEVALGDVAAMRVDGVVNAANNHFWMGGGVAGAIKGAGGGNIETQAMSLSGSENRLSLMGAISTPDM